jgi:hypothetical protein
MKSHEFIMETMHYQSKDEWVSDMRASGAVEFLKEKEFNTEILYAVDKSGQRLKGTWSDAKGAGMAYDGTKGDGIKFDKRRREFTKEI